MSEEVLSLVAKVSLDDNNFKSGLKNVQSQAKNLANNVKDVFSGIGDTLKNIGNTMSGWGKTITAGITAPVTALGVATAKTSIDFLKLKENTRTAFKVLLGSAEEAEAMLEDLYTFAKTTPFSYDTYLQAGKQLVAMGVSAKNAIPYLDGITNASIATGAGQEGITTLSEAIGRMSSKGKVQLEELNRMIEMGVPAVKILGNAYGVTEMEIYDMMKKGELLAEDTLPKLIDGMNNGTDGVNGMTSAYGGLASEMKGTLAGAIDSLKSKFRNMSVEMWNSEEAYPVLQEIIRSFTKTLEVLPKVFVGLTKAVVPVLTKVNEKLRSFGEYLDNADTKQLELIGKAILGLAVAGPAMIVVGKLTSALGGLFSAIGSIAGALPTIGSALSAVASVGFAPILAIVGAVIGVFVFLREEWDKVVATFKGWVEKTGILQSFQNLKDGLQSVWEKLGGLKDLFYLIGGLIVANLLPAIAGIMGVFNGFIKSLDGVIKMIGGVIDIFAGLGEVLVGLLTFDGDKIINGLDKIWQGIVDVVVGKIESVKGYISGFFEGVWGFVESLIPAISGKAIPEIERFGSEVSENTQKAVGAFMDLEEEATKSLNTLNWSGQEVTQDMADNITGTFQKMTDSIVNSVNEQKTSVVDTLNEMLVNSTEISEQEKESIMKNATSAYDEKTRITKEGNEKIKSIMQTASNENRQLTQEENEEINRIKSEMMNTAIATMSQSEAEQNAIFERLKINASNLSAERATEVVKNSIKQRDETIAAAEEEYNKRLAAAAQLRAQGTEEATLAADKIVEEATRQRDDTISKAEETHQKIVTEAKNQASEHINEVDWETGEVKSKWDIFKTDIGTTWENIKTSATEKWNEIKTNISNKAEDAKKSVMDTWDNIKKTASDTWGNIKKAIVKPIQDAWDKVKEMIDKIKGLFNFSWSLPKLKLPHFKVSGSFSLNPPSVPSFGIDWYKKGAILNDPTIFGLNPFRGNLMVGGEAGAEAIAPIDTLQDYVKQAVNESDNNSAMYSIISGIFEVLKEYLPNISKQKLVLDTGAIVGELSPYIDNNLGNINALKVRGN